MDNITGLVITAIVATIGVIKFRLIEELVKKITSNDQKAKGYAALLLVFSLIVIFTVVSLSLDTQQSSANVDAVEESAPEESNKIAEAEDEQDAETTPKSELEVKAAIVKDGIALTEQLVGQAKENKRIKDSTFVANRQERWVYRIGDWTSEDEKILDTHERMMNAGNLKVVKLKRKFLLVKEDYKTKEELEVLLEVMKSELQGTAIDIIDLNQFLTRKRANFSVTNETFRAKRKKIQLECLEAN